MLRHATWPLGVHLNLHSNIDTFIYNHIYPYNDNKQLGKKKRKERKMSPSTRRLMKEATDLTTNPSPHFTASPISDSNLYDWHFTLAGPPPPSPYAHGIYHGRILFPPTYPLRPPSFRFLTPTGRFEVNREICLSISGHHEESWQPAWGVRTALVALRSFMDGDARGQVGGVDLGDGERRVLAGESRRWRCGVCAEAGSDGDGRRRVRSNEEMLGEWRWGVCLERGIVVGEDGESERILSSEEQAGTQGRSDSAQQPESRKVPAQPPPPTPTTPTPSSVPSQPQPQPQPPAAAPATAPAQPQQATANTHSEDAWLDRAIVGVLIALVFMVMRRVMNSDDDYID